MPKNQNKPKPDSDEQPSNQGLYVQRLVMALLAIRRIRLGMKEWTHPNRWLYLPWKWAKRKSNHGGWFFVTYRTPLEMIVGVEKLARWSNKRSAIRR